MPINESIDRSNDKPTNGNDGKMLGAQEYESCLIMRSILPSYNTTRHKVVKNIECQAQTIKSYYSNVQRRDEIFAGSKNESVVVRTMVSRSQIRED